MDIDQIRRENLKTLWDIYGPTLYKKLGMSPSQFYNLRDGALDSKTGKKRGMRPSTARRIEEATNRSHGWLDVIHEKKGHTANEESQPYLTAENAITALENHLDKLDEALKTDALNLLSMYMRIKQPEMKASLIKMLETGNHQARKAA